MSGALTINLDLIDLDPRGWPRQHLNTERVEEFAQAYTDGGPDALDPVEVVALPTGRWLLVNGRHRVAAREAIGATDVPAVTVDPGTQDPVQFAYEYGLADAARSPMPLTRLEKQHAVARLLTEHPERTDVAIAALVGVSTKTVQRARRAPDSPVSHPTAVQGSQAMHAPPTTEEVARTLVRQLDRLWAARSLAMTVGLADTTKLGDAIAQAFADQVGPDDAVTWTERLATWATRAHRAAIEIAEQS